MILHAVQGANWQRGGGKGNIPKRIERPNDRGETVTSREELVAKRQAHDAELARRRAVKQRRQRGA